jgi:GntR family transcriptional repressor for pyruvate dehydrogenase complex
MPTRRHLTAMRFLAGQIVGGAIAPGELLAGEAELALEHGVSRGVARECIRGLEERGLVTVRHGIGATVNGPERWDVFDSEVHNVLLAGAAGAAVIAEYLECRRILQIESAGLAAERGTPAAKATLGEAVALLRTTAEAVGASTAADDDYQAANLAFHRAVVVAAGNGALARMTEPLHRAVATSQRRSARPVYPPERGVVDHERILAAILAGRVDEARTAMAEHLAAAEKAFTSAANAVHVTGRRHS